MEKLKKKIFLVIFLILTVFLISVLCIFNFQDYNHEKVEIENKFNRIKEEKNKDIIEESANQKNKPQEVKDLENGKETIEVQPTKPIFMDTIEAYTVKYNSNNEVDEVLNYTKNDISENEVKEIAEKILKNEKDKEGIKIGNLYFDEYSYSFDEQDLLTIIDNFSAKNKLKSLLKTSIIILVLVEIVIIVISIKITRWIIKPVIDSFEKQKRFVADASHELKTPIAVIMANAEALEKEPSEEKWLNNIKSESERMSELVTSLLDLASLEENKEIYKEEDISKITEISVLTFESLVYENKIKLKYDIQKDIKMECCNSQIRQLVAILLDNAIKHSTENGEINVVLKRQKNDIILEVSNKGKEISKDAQEKIFERFYREDKSRNRDTNRYGLGLAIAKSIVEKHGGKIMVESEKGVTTFKVVFK